MYYVGIDLGGTNIAIGVVNEKGEILKKDSVPTLLPRDYKEIVKDMASLINKLMSEMGIDEKDIKGIGMGCPGTVDLENGVIAYANNLDMHNVPITEELRKYFDKPISVINDANAAPKAPHNGINT